MARAVRRQRAGVPIPPSWSKTDSKVLTSNTSTYTFTACSIGAAAADRLVVVVAKTNVVAGSPSFSSCTIGGVTADKVVERNSSSGNEANIAIFQLVVASGTTADVVLNLADSGGHADVDVYRLVDLLSTTARDYDSNTVDSGTGALGVAGGSLTTPKDSVCICGAAAYTANATYTWAGGVTEDNEEPYGGESGSSSAASGLSTGASIAPTVQPSASGKLVMAAAAWR